MTQEERDVGFKEKHWIRDTLPASLGDAIRPRIMSFGYNANIWKDTVSGDITDPARGLVGALRHERAEVSNTLGK